MYNIATQTRNTYLAKHIRETYRPTNETGHNHRLQSETHWNLDFRSYFEAASPNCFTVFCKILFQSICLARIISKNQNKSKNSKICRIRSNFGTSECNFETFLMVANPLLRAPPKIYLKLILLSLRQIAE